MITEESIPHHTCGTPVYMDQDEKKANKPLEKIRVEFAVGSQEDGRWRWVTFGDDVNLCDIGSPTWTQCVTIDRPGPNKIQTIKIIREFTGCGLKEAKDAVENYWGGLVGVFEDPDVVTAFVRALTEAGNGVRCDRADDGTLSRLRTPAIGATFLYVPKKNKGPGVK